MRFVNSIVECDLYSFMIVVNLFNCCQLNRPVAVVMQKKNKILKLICWMNAFWIKPTNLNIHRHTHTHHKCHGLIQHLYKFVLSFAQAKSCKDPLTLTSNLFDFCSLFLSLCQYFLIKISFFENFLVIICFSFQKFVLRFDSWFFFYTTQN